MGLGALAIAALGRRAPQGERYHFVMSGAVCAIAFVAYYAMANGYGIVHTGGRLEFFARYVDWALTTPLLIGGLILIGLPAGRAGDDVRSRSTLLYGAIGADVFMILTGLFAGLSNNNPVKYGFYAISCLAFLVVLGVIWGPVRAAATARGGDAAALYGRLTSLLTTLWFVYPVLWILGTEGTKVFSLTLEIVVFAVIDLTAKVAFGLLLCSGVIRQGQSAISPTRAKAALA
jgi:bacteriorhodopsin